MKAVKISNTDYQKLLPNKDDRELIKYSGVFSKDAQNYWGFEHNNFREYLTAQFLNQLNIDQIKELIFSSIFIAALLKIFPSILVLGG